MQPGSVEMGLAEILGEFAQSAFVPGVNRGLLVVLHAVFIMLILTLVSLIILTGLTNVHTWALLGLAVGLYTALFWYALGHPHNLRHVPRFINEAYGAASNARLTAGKKQR